MRLVLFVMLLSASNAAAQGVVYQTTVAPKPDEDILGDCHYEITIPNPARQIRAVWVIFDRGRDMLRYYLDTTRGWSAFFVTRESETKDDWGSKTWEVRDAKIRHSRSGPPDGMISAGWLPSHRVGKEWLSFVRQPRHPVTSLA
jgi:hypothetical protein